MQSIIGTRPINKLIIKFSIPAVISMLAGALYNIIDQIFIGNGIEDIAMGATTVAFPIVTICMALALLCGVGGASNFNIESGRGEHSRARHAVGTALFLLCSGGIILMVFVVVFLDPMLRVCGATDILIDYSLTYASITAFGIPLLIITTGGTHLIRADKSPAYSMLCTLSGVGINSLLTPVFIFIFGWGIAGAAWATVIGQFASASLVIFYFLKRQKMNLKWHDLFPVWRRIKRILSLGLAASINQAALLIVQILINNQLAKYGAQSIYSSEIAITCAGVVTKVTTIFLGVVIGISHGCQPIWGFNYGAENYDRVKEAYKKAVILCLSVGIMFFIVFQIFPSYIIQMFGVKNEVGIIFAVRYFRIFMFMIFISGLQPMSSGFFTSIGKAKLGVITTLSRQITLIVPLMLVPLWQGIDGIIFAGPIADVFAAIITLFLALREINKMR